jgi:hypothetical protein
MFNLTTLPSPICNPSRLEVALKHTTRSLLFSENIRTVEGRDNIEFRCDKAASITLIQFEWFLFFRLSVHSKALPLVNMLQIVCIILNKDVIQHLILYCKMLK